MAIATGHDPTMRTRCPYKYNVAGIQIASGGIEYWREVHAQLG